MAYKIKSKKTGRPPQSEKYRTIRNFKALEDFEFQKIEGNRIIFKRKRKKDGK